MARAHIGKSHSTPPNSTPQACVVRTPSSAHAVLTALATIFAVASWGFVAALVAW